MVSELRYKLCDSINKLYIIDIQNKVIQKTRMQDQFWQQSEQVVIPTYQAPSLTQDDQQFDFSNNYSNPSSHQPSFQQVLNKVQSNTFVSQQVNRAIQDQQQRVNAILQQKANRQYQQKQSRKQSARKSLQDFFHKKDQQFKTRIQENIQKQRIFIEGNKNQEKLNGWQKVTNNIGVKQGQYKGKKDVNRMRQAIVRKRDDQKAI